MADFFLDPVAGNDVNDGTTFATRWKTLLSGATAARIGPGDRVKIIASPDPTTPGSATWTDNSGVVTWAANKNAIIDNGEVNWTAAANITSALSTAAKEGTNCVQLTPGSTFTTGKIAHLALGAPLDLSAFQLVSFWFRYGSLVTAGQLELRLCSDTLGVTAVHTIPLPAGTNGSWRTVVWDAGAALSSGINSIALYATADPGTTAMRIDNIVACKPLSDANCVTHEHVIGKNTAGEPHWYSVLSIAANSVTLGGANGVEVGSAGATNLRARPYRGTTESVATYVMNGIAGFSATDRVVQDSGVDGSLITFSGGWDRTNMSTQSGKTYLQGSHFLGAATSASAKNHLKFEKMGALNYTGTTGSFFADATCYNMEFDLEQIVGCVSGPVEIQATSTRGWAVKCAAIQGHTTQISGKVDTAEVDMIYECARIHGACIGTAQYAFGPTNDSRYLIGKLDNSGGFGITTALLNVKGKIADIYGMLMANNVSGDIDNPAASAGSLRLWDTTYAAPTFASKASAKVQSTHTNAVETGHNTHARYWSLASDTVTRHTASGISWKLSPLDTVEVTQYQPAQFPLARIACDAGVLVTVKCWMRRSDAGLTLGMRLPAKCIPGVPAAVTALMTAAINTWEEVTMTFTPTTSGVVEVYGIGYGSATANGWFDDLTITQG